MELAVALFTGGLIGYTVRALKVASDGPKPKPLPPAGGEPHDRAEAVRRILKHLERKRISELSEGNAAVIEGTVRATSVCGLVSPHGGAQCVGYHLDVRNAWFEFLEFRQIYEEARCGDFEIEDASGILRVSGEKLELAITDGPFSYMQKVPPALQSRVRLPGPLTVEEGTLLPGMRVLVCGVVTSELSVTDYRDGKPVHTLRATPSFPLVASTDRDLFLPGHRPIAPEELHKRGNG